MTKPITYFTPTKVIIEVDAECLSGEMLKQFGAKKVLIHYGSERIVENGLLNTITDSLKKYDLPFVTLGGVVPNPRLSKVYEGIELCKAENVDFILAVGGGSVIDSAKAIGLGLCYDGDVWDFYDNKAVPQASCPIACVLTLPAAGSEMSNSSVITKMDGLLKRGTKSEQFICKFALINPAHTLSLPENQTVNGVVDILMHTMERYFHADESLEITDRIAEGLLLSVISTARNLKLNPNDLRARTDLIWAGSLSHNGLTACGTAGGDWSTHKLEHELSGLFDVAHGAGLSTLWASWARFVQPAMVERFAQFAIRVMEVEPCETAFETGTLGINAMEAFFNEIGSPTNITALLGRKVTDAEISEMVEKCTLFGTFTPGYSRKLAANDIATIYQMANELK